MNTYLINYLHGRASVNSEVFSFSLECPFKVPSRRFKDFLGTDPYNMTWKT